MEQKQYKRTTRSMSEEQKAKISAALMGRPKTYDHKLHVSQGLKKYWQQIGN